MQRQPTFAAFYAASRPRLLRVLSAAAGDLGDAEDALQDAYIRTAERWAKVAGYDDPEGFTRRVALNLLSDGRRGRRRRDAAYRRAGPQDDLPDLSPETVLIVGALAALPLPQRQALALFYLLDMPVEQVAAELDRPVNTVKTHLARGRTRLAELLREDAHRER